MHFFNGDFRHNAEFEIFFDNQQPADQLYSSSVLGESFRYGLTAGVSPVPGGYHDDRIENHPGNIFSPEAVTAWGDMDTFLDFYNGQFPTSETSYRYGLVCESALDPNWVPTDAGLVDHLYLLYGLVESIDGDFCTDRVPSSFTWNADVIGNWSTTENWSPNVRPPGFGDSAAIDTGGSLVTVDDTQRASRTDISAGELFIGSSGTLSSAVVLSGGALTGNGQVVGPLINSGGTVAPGTILSNSMVTAQIERQSLPEPSGLMVILIGELGFVFHRTRGRNVS